MGEEKGYNGWSNYETWLANLWMDNDGGDWGRRAEELAQEMIDAEGWDRDDLTSALDDEIQAYLEETRPELQNSLFSDLLNAALREINTYEIAKHYADDVRLWAAGWNMPGYMPDNPPALFLSWDAARDYLAEEMELTGERAGKPEGNEYEQAAEYLRAKLPGNKPCGETVGMYHWFIASED